MQPARGGAAGSEAQTRCGARALRRGALAAALLGLTVGGALDCAGGGAPAENPTEPYRGTPSAVLSAAADLLRSQGYEVSGFDETFLELQGEKVEVQRRDEGSLVTGTVVRQQVLIDAVAEADQTRLNALFSVMWRRPTGERRNWVPESSVSQRLRSAFYDALHRELGDRESGAQ